MMKGHREPWKVNFSGDVHFRAPPGLEDQIGWWSSNQRSNEISFDLEMHRCDSATSSLSAKSTDTTSNSSATSADIMEEGHSRISTCKAQLQRQMKLNWTTVIMRNLPLNFKRGMLLKLIDRNGFARKYDFLYLPLDHDSLTGQGYAIINFCTAEDAVRFREHFDGFKKWTFPCKKVCAVEYCKTYQGLAAHIKCYRNAGLMHANVPDEYKPVLFVHGGRVSFPPPTKKIYPPKQLCTPHSSK